jgi:hypothetical protein
MGAGSSGAGGYGSSTSNNMLDLNVLTKVLGKLDALAQISQILMLVDRYLLKLVILYALFVTIHLKIASHGAEMRLTVMYLTPALPVPFQNQSNMPQRPAGLLHKDMQRQ